MPAYNAEKTLKRTYADIPKEGDAVFGSRILNFVFDTEIIVQATECRVWGADVVHRT